MKLSELKIENFKNYESAILKPAAKFTCFTGRNGAGKTNLLDAIYYLCSGKSYFNSSDLQLIEGDSDYFSLRGNIKINNEIEEVACIQIKGRKKVLKRNDIIYKRIAEHYGEFPAIMIAPTDIELIAGSSEIRRKWIDSTISLNNKEYLYQLIKYEKVITQRNAQLKILSQQQKPDRNLLEVYNEMLIPLAEFIHNQRINFLKEFAGVFNDYYKIVSEEREEVGIEYVSSLLHESLSESLYKNWRKELVLQRTSAGTHKDDLDFQIHMQAMKKYGSQGQQKSFLIALKLAQHQYIKEKKGFKPLLLLDDICERLDEYRLKHLFSLISQEAFGQVFITDTSALRLAEHLPKPLSQTNIYHIEAGKLHLLE